jgi:hypothetical protein
VVTSERSTVVGVFEQAGLAAKAIDALVHAGFAEQQIGVVTPGGQVKEAHTGIEVREDRAAEGAVGGAVAGGVLGAIAGGLVVGLVPPLGVVLAGGLLAGIVGGAAAGAAAGSWVGPFIALGFSEEEARRYEREFGQGRTILVVRAGGRAGEARQILERNGAHSAEPELTVPAR